VKINKAAVSASLAIAGLVFTSNAFALPGLSKPAPESTIQICVAQIGEQANYQDAGRVVHKVETKERRVSGHKLTIDTTVFGADGAIVIREYATICAVSDDSVTRKFKIRQKSL